MGNQTSCCAQNKDVIPSEFHFNVPVDEANKIPNITTFQDNSTNLSSALRKRTHTEDSVIKTQQDQPENSQSQDPKKKKKLLRKKPPPLTDLGSLQDCTSIAQEPLPIQAIENKYLENETEYEYYEHMDKKRVCWESTDEDRNLSIRLSERRPVLQERITNVNYTAIDVTESTRKDEARGIKSRKETIEAGIVAQKCGEEDIDEIEYEDDHDITPRREFFIKPQQNAYLNAISNAEKHYRSTHGERLTEVFETPREEIEEISDSVNQGYGREDEKSFNIPQDSATQSYRETGSKSNRSAREKHASRIYSQLGEDKLNKENTIYYTQEEVQKTVSTLYEDAFSGSMYFAKKDHEGYEKAIQDTVQNKSPVKEDETKLLYGLYQTCQSVAPSEAFEASPIRRGENMRSSFCGEDRKLFVSEIIKNIQMKNAHSKEKSTPQRENSWLMKAEREGGNIDLNKRESLQKEVQKLVDSAFKPRNSLLENMLRQSKDSSKGFESFVLKREDWREQLGKKNEYAHPFASNEYTAQEVLYQLPQQEQNEERKRYGLETPGFQTEGLLNKSWEKYSVQERKDMLLTKRFMDVPVEGAENSEIH